VFVSAVIARVDVKQVFREILPFIIAILLVVAALILLPPEITMLLPSR